MSANVAQIAPQPVSGKSQPNMAFAHAVNVTLGLPYLRVSVDHGTAFDIAGKGIADAAPMRYAIEWAARHAEEFAP